MHDMTPLEPDCSQLEIFIEGLFRHCGRDGSISLRAFYEGDGSKSFRISNIHTIHTRRTGADAVQGFLAGIATATR